MYMLKNKIILTTLIAAFHVITAHAQTPSPQPVKANQDLAAENAALKKENQELRKLLATKSSSENSESDSESAHKDVANTGEASKEGSENAEFWLSKSGKRHNPNCRYFKKSQGKASGKDEGTACGICGG